MKILTPNSKATKRKVKRILDAFYRTELRPDEDVIDNRSKILAKELHYRIDSVEFVISSEMKRLEENLKNKILTKH